MNHQTHKKPNVLFLRYLDFLIWFDVFCELKNIFTSQPRMWILRILVSPLLILYLLFSTLHTSTMNKRTSKASTKKWNEQPCQFFPKKLEVPTGSRPISRECQIHLHFAIILHSLALFCVLIVSSGFQNPP